MNQYAVFQIQLTREDAIAANRGDYVPKFHAWREALGAGLTAEVNPAPGLDGGFYEHVCDIEADTLDHVFEIGNVGPEERITRHAPMHSISVGDVIVTQGHRPAGYIVDRVGFKTVSLPASLLSTEDDAHGTV